MSAIKKFLIDVCFISAVVAPLQGNEAIKPEDAESRLPLTLNAIDESFALARAHVITPSTLPSTLVVDRDATTEDQENSATKILKNPLPESWENRKIIDEVNTAFLTIANKKRAGETPTDCSIVEGFNYTNSQNFDTNYAAEYLDLVLPVFPLKKLSDCTYAELSGEGTAKIDPLSIRSICLPNDLPSWPEGVLDGCRKLKRITAQGPSNNVKLTLYPSHHLGTLVKLKTLELPATVRVLADASETIINRDQRVLPTSLVSLTFPETFISIGKYALCNCTQLTTVILANRTALTTIGYGAFKNCSSLTSIDVSGCTNLTAIEAAAFQHCSNLILFDASGTQLNSMGEYAFQHTKLACAILPTTFKNSSCISTHAFPASLQSLIWKGSSAPSTNVFSSYAFNGASYSTAVSNGLKVTTVS